MEFFAKFKQLYNFSKSIEASQEFQSSINEEAWYDFQEEIKSYNVEMFETLYRVILNYHYLENKKLDDFPYKLKVYNEAKVDLKIENGVGNGIVFEPKNLPVCLQYMLLNWY
jgi:hypothetical protein